MEAQRASIGVSSTSPKLDGTTVRLLKASWEVVGEPLRHIHKRCLAIGHFPLGWKKAEVVMLPK